MVSYGSEIVYDPYDYTIDADPHPIWKRMRDDAPVYWNEQYRFWALSRFADTPSDWRERAGWVATRPAVEAAAGGDD